MVISKHPLSCKFGLFLWPKLKLLVPNCSNYDAHKMSKGKNATRLQWNWSLKRAILESLGENVKLQKYPMVTNVFTELM